MKKYLEGGSKGYYVTFLCNTKKAWGNQETKKHFGTLFRTCASIDAKNWEKALHKSDVAQCPMFTSQKTFLFVNT